MSSILSTWRTVESYIYSKTSKYNLLLVIYKHKLSCTKFNFHNLLKRSVRKYKTILLAVYVKQANTKHLLLLSFCVLYSNWIEKGLNEWIFCCYTNNISIPCRKNHGGNILEAKLNNIWLQELFGSNQIDFMARNNKMFNRFWNWHLFSRTNNDIHLHLTS